MRSVFFQKERGMDKILRFTVLALAVFHIGVAVSLTANHLGSPVIASSYDSWHMRYFMQFAQGGHCYYPPEDHVHDTDGYTPLASEIFGWTLRLFGNDIRFVRLVAALFGAGAIVLLGFMAARDGGGWPAGVLVAGLACALEPLWYLDVGPNTLHVAFAVAGVFVLTRPGPQTWPRALLATACLFASFWSKQTGLAYMAVGVLVIFLKDQRQGVVCGLAAAALTIVAVGWYERLPDAEFLWWTWKMNQNQPLIVSRLWEFLVDMLASRRSMLIVGVLMLMGMADRQPGWWKRPDLLFLGAAFVVGGISSLKYGSGYSQAWLFFLLLIVAGLRGWRAALEAGSVRLPVFYGLAILQLAAFITDVRPVYLNQEDRARFDRILQILATPDAKTYYANQGYLNSLVGKETYANAGVDCWRDKVFRRDAFPASRRAFLESDPWDLVIIDIPLEDNSFVLYERLNAAYRPVMEIPASSRYTQRYGLRGRKVVFARKEQGSPAAPKP
jgi:hypothetical protein